MKNQKLTRKFSLALVISILIYLISCQKLEDNRKISSIHSEIKVENKKYECTNLTIKNKKPINNERIGENYTINDITVNFSENGMQTLYNDIENFFNGDIGSVNTLPKIIVLYTSDELTDIHFDSVKAISFFVYTDSVLLQRFFRVDNGNTVEDSELSLNCSYFSLYELDLLTIDKFDNQNVGWALFQGNGNSTPQQVTNGDFNNFGKKVIDISEIFREFAVCTDCGGEKGNCEDHGDHDGHGNPMLVCGSGCFSRQLNSLGIDEGFIVDSESVNLDIAYDFRDNFLVNSDKGRQYIDYYYKLSYISQTFKLVNSDNFFQRLNLAYDVTRCAEILEYGNDSAIPISSSLKDEALELINSYREITPNAEYAEILNQIESDINYYSGKTRAEIIESLQ